MTEYLNCFKEENVRAVYDIIKKPGKRTRTDIASETGISLPTVIKIVDAFAKAGMVRLYSAAKNGRSTKFVSLHPEKYCVVFDLTVEKFKAYVIDLHGRLILEYTSLSLIYGPYRMIDEIMNIQLRDTLGMLKEKFKRCHCFGYGFLTPGYFEDDIMKVSSPRVPHINRLNYKKILEDNPLHKTVLFCDIRECYAQSINNYVNPNSSSLLIFFDLNDISTGYLTGYFRGNTLSYAPFGKAVIRDGHILESICREILDPHQVAPIFAEEIFELSKKVPIDNVFIMGDRYSPMYLFAKLVNSEFNKYRIRNRTFLPEIHFEENAMPHVAEIAAKIRDKNYLG